MDSSSDSEEFYECDNDMGEDVEGSIIGKTAQNHQLKEEPADVHLVPKINNNGRQMESIQIVQHKHPTVEKAMGENKKHVDSMSKSNNNPDVGRPGDYPLTSHLPDLMQQAKDKKPNSNIASEASGKKEISNNNNTLDDAPHSIKGKPGYNTTKKDSKFKINVDDHTNHVKPIEKYKLEQSTDMIKYETIEYELQDNINMWDIDDWGEADQKDRSDPISNIETNNASLMPNKSSNIEDKQFENSSSIICNVSEESLWNDEDDWGKLEPGAKTEPDVNLWGDGDSWDVDILEEKQKKDTPEKPTQIGTKCMQVKHQEIKTSDAKSTLDVLSAKEESSWGGWSSWGINSVLSTAANITTSVSQGITTALESGMGVLDPTELAKIHRAEEEARREAGEEVSTVDCTDDNFVPFSLGNLVPGVSKFTKLVETTGSKVITTGIGTLETIGKKTYEVLQENDPQLKKKRALLKLLGAEKPVLSAILREAKGRAEAENEDRERKHYAKKANYETIFDDYTGLVHLEALEMLSKQCDIKLESILSQTRDVTEIRETMEQIKDLCELNTDEDADEDTDLAELKLKIAIAVKEIDVRISYEALLETYQEISKWIDNCSSKNPTEIHSNAIENLAKITAMAVEQYHKAGELLLVKEHRSTADEADSLVQLTTAISALISLLSTKYTEKLKHLTSQASNDEIRSLVSDIYLEAANSSRYVEDAFGLLIPVIQVGAV